MGSRNAAAAELRDVGFVFREISVEDAYRLVPQKVSAYQRIKETIIAHVSKVPEGKTFAFQLPRKPHQKPKELSEATRRGICNTVNQEFSAKNLPWRISYSGESQCFVILPFRRRNATKKLIFPSKNPEKLAMFAEKAKQLETIMRNVLKVTPERIRNDKTIRDVFSLVANRDLLVPVSIIAEHLGAPRQSIWFYMDSAKEKNAPELTAVRKVIGSITNGK